MDMSGSYSPAPAPPPEGFLPYPWISQYDENYQATFYANAETGETSWTPPAAGSAGPSGSRAIFEPNQYDSSGYGASGQSPYPGQGPPGGSAGGGEASSFFAGSGTAPQAPSQDFNQSGPYGSASQPSQSQQQQYDENGQPVDGERGLGKVLVGGGMAYFAYKMYKDYQKGKHNKHQFKPPSSGPFGAGSGLGSMFGGQQQQQGYQQGYGGPPMPSWQHKPSRDPNMPPSQSPYPGSGGPSNGYYGEQPQPYEPSPFQPPQGSAGYPSPAPYGQPGPADPLAYGGHPQSYPQSYAQGQNYGGPPAYGPGDPHYGGSGSGKSAWGDPRFS